MPVERFIPNVGPGQRRVRMLVGLGGLVVCAFLIAGLLSAGAGPLERLVIFPPLWVSLVALYEAPRGTSVLLAMRGISHHEDEGTVEDDATRAHLRRQGIHLAVQAGVVAAMATAVVVVIPV